MSDNKLEIVITANDKASATMSNLEKGVSKTFGTLGSLAKTAGIALAVAGGATIAFGIASMKAYADAEVGAIKLSKNLLTVKGNTLEHVSALLKQADAMQKYGVVEGDAITAGQSQLATFGLQASTIETLTPKIADMAVQLDGYNVSAETMTTINNLAGKVMTGQVGALSKYGVTLNDVQKKIMTNGTEQEKATTMVAILSQNYGELNKALGDTPEGKWIEFKHTMGDAQEQIGGVLTRAVAPLMAGITAFVQGDKFKGWIDGIEKSINNWVESVGGSEGIKAKLTVFASYIMDTVVPTMAKFLKSITDNWDTIKKVAIALGILYAATVLYNIAVSAYAVITGIATLATAAWSVAVWAFNAAILVLTSPIGLVVVAVVALIAIGVLLYKNWDMIKAKAIEIWDSISTYLSELWTGIKTAISNTLTAIWNKIKEVFNSIVAYIKTDLLRDIAVGLGLLLAVFILWPVMLGAALAKLGWWLWDNAFKPAIEYLIKNVPVWFEKVVTWFKELPAVLGTALSNLGSKIGDAFSSTGSSLKTNIPKWFDGIVQWFKDLPQNIFNALSGLGSKIGDAFKSAFNWVKNNWGSFTKGFGDGFQKALDIAGLKFASGGIVPQYLASGGFAAQGTDTVPAMLTPGEMILNKGQQTRLFNQLNGGGSVMGGKSYLVGERGPEMFTAPSSGSINNNPAGGKSVVNNFNFSFGNAFVGSKEDLTRDIMSQINRRQELNMLGAY